jgi:serine-type D-Ala-D-Ala carboxypeptidase/endopeptidase (penicillin-binding protein 4)
MEADLPDVIVGPRRGLTRGVKNLLRLTLASIFAVGVADVALLTRNFGSRAEAIDNRVDVPTPIAVLSARRIPEVLAEAAGGSFIADRLIELFGNERMGTARQSSCAIVRQAGRTLVAEGADRPVVPASTMKLITATAVLDTLKPDVRFETKVLATATAANGTIAGDVQIVGGGDPLLATSDYLLTFESQPQLASSYEDLANKLAASGIKTITGDVVGDDRLFDAERAIPSWKSSYLLNNEAGPLSALAVNDGFFNSGKRRGTWRRSEDPAANAAEVMMKLLKAKGISVGGVARSARIDEPSAGNELASLPSLPVSDIVGQMLVESDNNTAEMLLKHLSVAKGTKPGTTAGGIEVVREVLLKRGIDPSGLTLVDGSGLDRGNKVTCTALVQAIEVAPESLRSLLAVGGETGTLAARMKADGVRGKVRAKTGTLNGVSALVGDIETQGAGRVEFAMVLNELPAGVPGVATGDELAVAVAAYPQYLPSPPTTIAGSTAVPPATAAPRVRSLDISAIAPPEADQSLLPDSEETPAS